jgi:hypothetical protein
VMWIEAKATSKRQKLQVGANVHASTAFHLEECFAAPSKTSKSSKTRELSAKVNRKICIQSKKVGNAILVVVLHCCRYYHELVFTASGMN